MTMEQRVETALARIEAAAARIEAASRANAARAPAGGDDPLLAMKHAQLRASVGATLKDLDALIGSIEHG
jgi:hypothetical protein